jgi:hypothetical protein
VVLEAVRNLRRCDDSGVDISDLGGQSCF